MMTAADTHAIEKHDIIQAAKANSTNWIVDEVANLVVVVVGVFREHCRSVPNAGCTSCSQVRLVKTQ
jgi:hypothetical protein